MRAFPILLVAVCGGIVVLAPPAARAQLAQQYFPSDIPGYAPDFSASVRQRQAIPDVEHGFEAGSFVVRPSVGEGIGYNSSVLGTPDSGSPVLSSDAAVRINSDWTRNALGASFSVGDRRYLTVGEGSYTNWSAGLGGSLDVGQDVLTAAYSHLGLNLGATTLGTLGVVDPVGYGVDDVRLAWSALRGVVSIDPMLEVQRFRFGAAGGAVPVDYASLDHDSEAGSLVARFELSPGNALVGVLRGTGAQFDQPASRGRGYLDLAAFGGLDLRADALLQYRLLVGVERRSFRQAGASSVTSPTVEASVIWYVRRMDTVELDAARHLDDAESPFARNQTLTSVGLRLDHELRRDIVLSVNGSVKWSDSQPVGAGGSFRQVQTGFGASASWSVSRSVNLSLSYSYAHGVFGGDLVSAAAVGGVPLAGAVGSGRTTFTANSVGFRLSYIP